jgi:tRNA (cmo5U34)-methyltransferase
MSTRGAADDRAVRQELGRARSGVPDFDESGTVSSLGHMPAHDRWTFDETVTAIFSDMLQRSIPQYDVMRRAVFDIGARFVRPSTQIVDLGCARGDALASFLVRFRGTNIHVGVDVSAPMLEAARGRFAREIADDVMRLMPLDLTTDYPDGRASVTLCVLTLQFIDLGSRHRILRTIFEHTVPGGALILVEKVIGAGAELGHTMVALYHQLKANHGYSAAEIERKRLALEGVLVPATARWNEQMLFDAGFGEVDCFWRWMNFAAWVAVKTAG